jgi:glutamyl-tRNA reductase
LNKLLEQPILFAVGINHKTASISARENIYVQESEIPALIAALKETLTECVVLSTCNRTEIYGVTTRTDVDLDFYKDLLINFKNAGETVKREHFFGLVSCAACQQLFKVSTSIDSKIVGDTQILGQLRQAYSIASNNYSTGKIINQLFQRAFKVGKESRTETSLHKGAVSISLAAVELASEIHNTLSNKNVLVIGAGETARLTAECLLKKRVGKITITNRTRANSEELLAHLRKSNNFVGEIIDFTDFKSRLNEADIVITSTSSSEPILNKSDFARQTNKILLIDIAMPRDIASDVAGCRNVTLKNIDDLHAIVDKNYQQRMADIPLVKKIIMNEMSDFLVWYYSLPLLPAQMRAGAKPDDSTLAEIVKVKKFLLKNVSELHKMAMKNGAEDFLGHVQVVNQLIAMKNAESKRFEIEA